MQFLVLLVLAALSPVTNLLPDKCETLAHPFKTLQIGAMFPMDGSWPGGIACLPAAQLALAHVNCHPTHGLVDGYQLKLDFKDSNCDAGRGTANLYEFLYKQPDTIVAMLGPGCSSVSTAVAEAAHLWNLLMVSYGSSSPALSNRERFPTFFRTHPSALIHNPTRVTLFKKFKWTRVFALVHLQEVFTTTVEDLTRRCGEEGISLKQTTFQADPRIALQSLKQQDARIIVGLFYEVEARQVFCEAFKQGVYGKKVVWFILGWFPDNWWVPVDTGSGPDIPCTVEEMRNATDGHFTTEILQLDPSVTNTLSGLLPLEFNAKMRDLLRDQFPDGDPSNAGGFPESPLAYDAVWALAIALNKTILELKRMGARPIEREFRYGHNGTTFNLLKKHLDETDFRGVSGSVTFASGDRVSSVKIELMRNGSYEYYASSRHDVLQMQPLFSTDAVVDDASSNSVGGGGGGVFSSKLQHWAYNDKLESPRDGVEHVNSLEKVNSTLFIALSIIAVVGAVSATVLLFVTILMRRRKVISESKPGVNCVMLVGCQMALICVVLNGVEYSGESEGGGGGMFSLCQGVLWLTTIGFTLSYGSLFAKIWSLHVASSQVKPNRSSTSSGHGHFGGNSSEMKHRHAIFGGGNNGQNASSNSSTGPNSNKKNGVPHSPPPNPSPVPAVRLSRQPSVPPEPPPTVSVRSSSIYLLVGVLLLLDLIYLASFSLVAPLGLETEFLQERNATADGEVRLRPYIHHCRSDNYNIWIGVLFGYKGLLLVLGAFFAYDTRNVHCSNMNDCRYVGLSIYNIVTLLCITGPVTMLIKSHPDASYTFSSLAIILCAYVTQVLIFVPKLKRLFKDVPDDIPCDGANGASASSKKDLVPKTIEDDSYKKLLNENEVILKQIMEKEKYLSELKAKMESVMQCRFRSRARGPIGRVPIAHMESFTEFLFTDCNPENMTSSSL